MEALVRHLVVPLLSQPDALALNTVEGEDVTVVELSVHDDDRHLFGGEDSMLRAVRSVLSAAAGSRKATVELIGGGGDGAADGED